MIYVIMYCKESEMRYKKPFWVTLFWKQNKYHRHGVLVHTLKVLYHVTKTGRFDLIPAALLHDIGKPFVAHHDAEDIKGGCKEYSFTNHEEISWYLIRNWPSWLLSDYSKEVIRHHYLIRALGKEKTKNPKKYNRLKKRWDKLSKDMKKDLKTFIIADDLAK